LRKANETQAAELYGPRITEADTANDRKSLYRKLDKKLFLIVKRQRDQHAWQFPQGDWVQGEMIREVCNLVVEKVHEPTPLPFFFLNFNLVFNTNARDDSLVKDNSFKNSPRTWTSILLETALKVYTAMNSLVTFKRNWTLMDQR